MGKSHYGISRTLRVFFDIITIRFLMRYMTRPLHFFGPPGLLGLFAGGGIMAFLLAEKLLWWRLDLFALHGPLLVLGMMLTLVWGATPGGRAGGRAADANALRIAENPIYRVEHVYGGPDAANISGYPKAKTLASRQAGG